MPKKSLTIEDVKRRVKKIAEMDHTDGEQPHGNEDALYVDVLKAIAKNDKGISGDMAKIALQVRKMSFPRWYA